MDINDFIGYFISFLTLIYFISSFFKYKKGSATNSRGQKENQESKKKLKKLLKSLDLDLEDEKFLAPQGLMYANQKKQIATHTHTKSVSKQYQHTQFDKSIVSKQAAEQSVAFIQQARPSRGRNIVLGLKSAQDLIIIREILGPPKSVGAIQSHEYWG